MRVQQIAQKQPQRFVQYAYRQDYLMVIRYDHQREHNNSKAKASGLERENTMAQIIISNYDQILEELTNLLIDFDLDQNEYQTDVYLYIGEDGKARLDTFINVGGDSWLNDDHITIYCDRPHYEGWPRDENGNPISDIDYREYLNDLRSDYVERAYSILDEAEIDG